MDLFVVPTISFRLLYGLLTIGPACVASGQKPSALLEKCHEKIMRRVATTTSPSESRAANRGLGLCFVVFVSSSL
jgi:hypothetical protein